VSDYGSAEGGVWKDHSLGQKRRKKAMNRKKKRRGGELPRTTSSIRVDSSKKGEEHVATGDEGEWCILIGQPKQDNERGLTEFGWSKQRGER